MTEPTSDELCEDLEDLCRKFTASLVCACGVMASACAETRVTGTINATTEQLAVQKSENAAQSLAKIIRLVTNDRR